MLRDFRPATILCQTPYDGAAALLARRLARVPARVVVEVHGDWRTSTRLYGSPSRRALGRLGDAVAAAALRRADAVRTVSPFTAGLVRELGVEPAGDFPAYMDLEPFVSPRQPLPDRPVALFVGVLEAYKSVDVLAAAWRLAAPRVPDASLHVVGKGTRTDIAESLVRDCGARWDRELSSAQVAAAMDGAWVLVLPSRSEGMGRVLVEAFCRGRGVVGTRAGSIPDLVTDGESGLLVEPDDPSALADALVRVLSDRVAGRAAGRGRPCRCRAVAADAGGVRAAHSGARRMRSVVFITQAADPAHPVLGATLPKIRALAERVDEVVVLADTIVPEALPENCRARSFAASSQTARGARCLAALVPELTRRPVAVVAHMAPVYALIAAPLARPLRVPLLLWFTQQAGGALLDAAERVVDARADGGRAERPAALGEGACDRARDRRRLAAVRAGASSAAAPAARARPLRAREGLGDRPARTGGAAGRDADAARADAHRRGPHPPAEARAPRGRARRPRPRHLRRTRSPMRRCRTCSVSRTPS